MDNDHASVFAVAIPGVNVVWVLPPRILTFLTKFVNPCCREEVLVVISNAFILPE